MLFGPLAEGSSSTGHTAGPFRAQPSRAAPLDKSRAYRALQASTVLTNNTSTRNDVFIDAKAASCQPGCYIIPLVCLYSGV